MLLLRKSCQEVLDAHGFDMLHIEVHNKYLCIVGECGKKIVSISGISFANTRINENERIYATELFAKFIDKYKDEIKKLILLRKELIDFQSKMTCLDDICKVDTNTTFIDGKGLIKEFTVIFNSKHRAKLYVKKDSVKISDYLSFEDFNCLVAEIEEDYKFAKNIIQELEKKQEIENEIKEFEIHIQSCNI